MPTLPTLMTDDLILREYSNDTSDSSVPSTLNTPADEHPLYPIDVLLQDESDDPRTPRPPTIPQEIKQHPYESAPKIRSLSKAVTKAKQFAQSLTKTSKFSKKINQATAESLTLPTPEFIRSYDMFFDMPGIERKDDSQTAGAAHDDAHAVPGKAAHSLFSLPNTGIENASAETHGPFPLGDGRGTSCDSDKSLSSLATAELIAPCEYGSSIGCAPARNTPVGIVQEFCRSDKLEHNLASGFGRVMSQSSDADNEASSLELTVFSPRIKTLSTATEFVRQSIDLRHTGVERYSLEVNPPTSDDERDIDDDEDTLMAEDLRQSDSPPQLDAEQDTVESGVALEPYDSLDFEDLETPSWEWPAIQLTPGNILLLLIKIACFVPWCVVVGGAIVMYPTSLELVTFGVGYQSSLGGIRRFGYWVECAFQHVAIFLAFIVSLWWCNRPLGVLALAGVVAGAACAWGDFVLDRSVPLGEDDRQAIYLAFAHYGFGAGSETLVLKKTEMGEYLAVDKRHAPAPMEDDPDFDSVA